MPTLWKRLSVNCKTPFSAPVASASQRWGAAGEWEGRRERMGEGALLPALPTSPRPGKRQHIEARGSQHQAPGC